MISIVIPAYNCERYIRQCLDSILEQSYTDLEIICVEDCSTDGTLEIIERYVARDARVKLIRHTHNQGISASRNDGMAIAKGEWLMFVDSDDWIDSDTCRQTLEVALRQQADTVAWCYTREFENISIPKLFINGEQVWEEDVCELHRRLIGPLEEELTRPDLLDTWGTIWGKLYCRRLIMRENSISFVDTNVVGTAEDVVFNIDYFVRAKKVVWIPQPLYHYRKDMLSYSNRHRDYLSAAFDNLYDNMEERINKYHMGADARKALQNRIALSVLGLGIIAMRSGGTWKQKYKSLHQLLRRERQRQALSQLTLQYFPLHWRLFYFAAKHRLTPIFMVMQLAINKIIDKNH
jgi:glycosyltransferase EpsH